MTSEELLQIAKPILFNTEMVRAILKGRKTVTRRIVKFLDGKNPNWTGYIKDGLTLYNGTNEPCNRKPPYQVEQILYVRETWGCYTKNFADAAYFMYKADFPDGATKYMNAGVECDIPKWKPSIHMPKDAARIFLKVKDVRVELLQDITENDAYGEGTDPWDDACYENNGWTPTFSDPDSGGPCDVISGFHKLWNSTIKPADIDTYGWNANPYVWRIEFERVYPD